MQGAGILGDASGRRDAGPVPGSRRLAVGFGALVAATFGLLVLGALVRAHGAGLSCPDWPLCFGSVIPTMDLRVAFEWSHRVVAGSVSLVFLGLALATLRRRATPRATRRLILLAGALLALQVLLGALTVWKLLASWTVTSHLLTGNAFTATLLLVALSLRDEARGARPGVPAPAAARAALAFAAALLGLQLILGGLVSSRFAGMACPEWPTCNGGLWFPSWRGSVGLHLLHRMNGYALLAALGAAAVATRHTRLRALGALALGLGALQVVVGISNVLLAIPVEITGLHSALAAALVLTLTAALRAAWTGATPSAGC